MFTVPSLSYARNYRVVDTFPPLFLVIKRLAYVTLWISVTAAQHSPLTLFSMPLHGSPCLLLSYFFYSSSPRQPKWLCQATPGFEASCFPMVYTRMLKFLKVTLPTYFSPSSFALASQVMMAPKIGHTGGFYSSHPLWLIVPFPHETLPLLFSQFPAQASSPNLIISWKCHHFKCTLPSPLPASYPKHFLWACFDTCSNGLLFFVKPWGSKGQEWDLSYLCIASTNKALQNHYRESICPLSDWCGIGGNRSASSLLFSNFSHYRREGDVLPPVPQITKTRKMNFSVLETETPFLFLTLTTLHTTPYRNHQGPAGEIIHNNFIHSLQFLWHYSETLTSILLLWGSSRRRILHSFLPCHRQLLAWVWSLEPWKQRDTIR